MKRVYTKTTVMAGGTKVTVKQILGKGSPTIVNKVGRIVVNAQGRLS